MRHVYQICRRMFKVLADGTETNKMNFNRNTGKVLFLDSQNFTGLGWVVKRPRNVN